jgi:hypothetical protein
MTFSRRLLAALELGRRTLSPTCREVARLQALARTGQLTLGQRTGLRIHLVLCGWCRRYGRQLDALRRMFDVPEATLDLNPTPGLSPSARDRLKRTLANPPK